MPASAPLSAGTSLPPARTPALDGLRGLAIALVVLFHVNLLGCGWIGVQLFFVLSGYLITQQLLALRERHTLSGYLKIFYARRALRIFPAYYVYLGLMLLLAATLARHTDEGQRVLAQSPSAALYFYNWSAMAADHERTFFLSHLWSLAIEEQFYLLWPLLLFALRGAPLSRVLWSLILLGPLLRAGIFTVWPAPATVAICTLSQLDAFATGALLTQIRQWPRPGLKLALVLLAALLLGLLGSSDARMPLTLGYANGLSQHAQFIWGYSVVNLLGAALLLAVLQGWGARIFTHTWARRVGERSYALYLWHFPLAHVLGALIPLLQAKSGLSVIPATLLWLPLYLSALWAISAASWRWVEAPAQALKSRFSQ